MKTYLMIVPKFYFSIFLMILFASMLPKHFPKILTKPEQQTIFITGQYSWIYARIFPDCPKTGFIAGLTLQQNPLVK